MLKKNEIMSEIIAFFLGKYRAILTCCECMRSNGISAVSMGGCVIKVITGVSPPVLQKRCMILLADSQSYPLEDD